MPTILIIHLIQICCHKPKRHSASENKNSKWQTILSILFKHSKISKFEQKHKHRVRDNKIPLKIKGNKWQKNSKTIEDFKSYSTKSLWFKL
jgi:hypothetical protein